MTGEDLEYKPGLTERAKFEYSAFGEALSKGLKKDDRGKKVVKYDNNLVYKSVHNFNKYSTPNYNETSSIGSKFDILNKFYKDFRKLEGTKSQNKNTKQKRIIVLKNASILYDELICAYKNEYNQNRLLKAMIKIGGKNMIKKI